eukprot:2992997-Rhodomonas_salina.3
MHDQSRSMQQFHVVSKQNAKCRGRLATEPWTGSSHAQCELMPAPFGVIKCLTTSPLQCVRCAGLGQ